MIIPFTIHGAITADTLQDAKEILETAIEEMTPPPTPWPDLTGEEPEPLSITLAMLHHHGAHSANGRHP